MRQYQFCTALILLGVCLRIGGAVDGWTPNLQMLPALLLLCAWSMNLSWQRSMFLSAMVWVVTDAVIALLCRTPLLSWDLLGIMMFYGLSFGILRCFCHVKVNAMSAVVVSLLAAICFYCMTNAISFLVMPNLYPRTLIGFYQAQWIGPEGYGPTWCFLKTSVIGNLLASLVFLLAQHRFYIYHISAKERAFVRL